MMSLTLVTTNEISTAGEKGASQGVHSVSLLHSTIVRKILKNILNFTKYWKISHKIVLLNPPPSIPFQLRKPLVSPDTVGTHFEYPLYIIL